VRIVSLLPSTTEILFAIGAGDDVVGVTFECDFPPEARSRRIVSTSAMPEGLTPAEIDAFVVGAMSRGDDLYHLDEGALSGLDADLVVTQDSVPCARWTCRWSTTPSPTSAAPPRCSPSTRTPWTRCWSRS
jgi:iron complex transport system substrate-binding protein